MKVLLTGATGFIGSNIAKGLLSHGYEVYATYRNTSSFEKCIYFKDRINWINTDSYAWKEYLINLKPDYLIHNAWSGIEIENRNNWNTQIQNFFLAKEYFELAKDCNIKKIISLGSQAEYGKHNIPVNELTLPIPNDAYGAVKTLTANCLRNMFESSTTEWYWIRVFSVFGEGDNNNWLIPTVISKLLKNESISLTSCEQKYNYLYIEDFVIQLVTILNCSEKKSGIYNLCNSESISLKELLIKISKLMNVSQDLLKFGEISQRTEQNMYIVGDNTKFIDTFSIEGYNQIGLINGLQRTIDFIKKT